MARHPIPQVIDDHLTPLDVTGEAMPAIMVGSAGWYAWLNDATTRSFAFHSPQGVLTARRERRHGTWYWYAYRSQHGHLSKAYLGKSEELTTERLHNVDGASNREIAQRLVLSVNTVKKHVFNICGKQGVQSRTQAIAKARTLDLLRGAGEKL
jgi:hypothetical protein